MTDFLQAARDIRAQGNAEAAYQYLAAGARSDPSPEMWYTLGQSLHEHQRFEPAIACFRRGDLCDVQNLVNLGWCLHMVGRSEEGVEYLRRAVELGDDALMWANLSQAQLRCGLVEEALRSSTRAMQLGYSPYRLPPDDPQHGYAIAHSMALFAAGKWAGGFEVYESRIPFKLRPFLEYPYKRWEGEIVDRLFIQAEMGVGDCLWMLRWVPAASERVKKVVLYVHTELLSLVQRWAIQYGNIEVLPANRELPQADAFVPMMSLPVVLGMCDEPIGVPYLSSYGGNTKGPIKRVGVVWQSSQENAEAKWRDIPVLELMPLLEMPEIEVHSLQMGEGRLAFDRYGLHALMRDRSPEISNFADTQSILAGLDLVVGCDTAVMHLAGAMGKRTWLLRNKLAAPWIFPWGGGKCCWYEGMDVMCRERDEESWLPLMRRVVERLRVGR